MDIIKIVFFSLKKGNNYGDMSHYQTWEKHFGILLNIVTKFHEIAIKITAMNGHHQKMVWIQTRPYKTWSWSKLFAKVISRRD